MCGYYWKGVVNVHLQYYSKADWQCGHFWELRMENLGSRIKPCGERIEN